MTVKELINLLFGQKRAAEILGLSTTKEISKWDKKNHIPRWALERMKQHTNQQSIFLEEIEKYGITVVDVPSKRPREKRNINIFNLFRRGNR